MRFLIALCLALSAYAADAQPAPQYPEDAALFAFQAAAEHTTGDRAAEVERYRDFLAALDLTLPAGTRPNMHADTPELARYVELAGILADIEATHLPSIRKGMKANPDGGYGRVLVARPAVERLVALWTDYLATRPAPKATKKASK